MAQQAFVKLTEIEAQWIIDSLGYAASALSHQRVYLQKAAEPTADERDDIEFLQNAQDDVNGVLDIVQLRLQEFFTGSPPAPSMISAEDVDC